MIDVASRQRAHISLDTRPWASVEEFDSARATLDAWRRKRCLKTMADWQSLDEAIALNLIRSRLRGFDPEKKGLHINCVTATLDGGCGYGGALNCAGITPMGEIFELIET